MGVPSKAQLLAAKADALAAANKSGRHRRILTKKKLKHERNQVRNKRKREQSQSQRGRASEAAGVSSSSPNRSKLKVKQSKPSKPMKAKVAPGQGSGTPGARAAAAKVPKAVRISKRGGRRLKPTWRSFGVRFSRVSWSGNCHTLKTCIGDYKHPLPYLAASAVSSVITFPVWKAATIGQSGFTSTSGRFWEAVKPPYRGSFVVVSGRTWAQAVIFFGSEKGSTWLRHHGWSSATSSVLPPLLISAKVQIANQPFVNFAHKCRSPVWAVLNHLWRTGGLTSLWLGTGVSIVRTAPKYVAAVAAKDKMEELLPPAEDTRSAVLRSVKKSLAASVVGSVITNPLDVAQNEMYQTSESFFSTVKRLQREEGCRWMLRGCGKSVVASAMPLALTIFLTDAFLQRHGQAI
eukprot:symbB.v1.2.024091.t1/scaffold2255.1/size84268/4